ncbi:hypothetical protein P170DRAFT_425457 [Aspergillus steynii IBT 23096]|uniref:F-box domain-containing protein n=1 Tax=Aspergillus steynii IBT 23096 TaxID=1392250 RepID=A0A2I2GE67_9EURO|nr:uncharacterized protein P170DRAFT_425457 [Aspergillus steynii IBT 23096]PLB51199.1 hypothetical protein P170DRAFT_425457 [Aspergillus steynii IBT 23096]
MVKLQDLPTELLSHIVSYVADDHSLDQASLNGRSKDDKRSMDDDDDDDDDIGDIVAFRDLYNLCLVSHKFRDLAQPLLFQDFDEDYLTGDNRSIICFTRAVTLRPDLAACVKTVDTSSTGIELPMDMPHPPERLRPEDIRLFTRAVQDLDVGDDVMKWLMAVENRDLSVFLALLLSKTPNVSTLAIPAGEFHMKPVSHLFTQIPSFLSKLEHIILGGDQLYTGYNMATYQEFFNLPLLKDLIVDYGNLVEANCPRWARGSLSIESPLFRLCHIDCGSMRRFVRGCRALKSFTLANFSPDPRQGRYDEDGRKQFKAAQLHAELLAHKDTLKFLRFEQNHPDSTKIGSLREFSVLEKITIQHQLLPAKPQFPPSLKTLYVTDCNTSIRNMVQHVADECRQGLLPALKTFKVLTLDITQPIKLPGQRIPNGQTPEQCFLSIRNKFIGTNVEFQICPYAIEDDDEDDFYDDLDPYEYNYDSEDDFYGAPMGGSRMASALLQALRSEGYDMGMGM